jgi:hypothetical protein
LGFAGEVEQRDSFRKIGIVGAPVPLDLTLAALLLLTPLVRHFFEEGGIHQPVELIDIHRVDAIVQPLRFSLKPLDCFVMLAALVGVAGVKGIAHPFQHLEWHYTPKHGSWLDLAESELAVLTSQCLDRRIPDKQTLTKEVAAWVRHRSHHHAKADWHFTTDTARLKLKHLYPAV